MKLIERQPSLSGPHSTPIPRFRWTLPAFFLGRIGVDIRFYADARDALLKAIID